MVSGDYPRAGVGEKAFDRWWWIAYKTGSEMQPFVSNIVTPRCHRMARKLRSWAKPGAFGVVGETG
jgi:hypothetical protein